MATVVSFIFSVAFAAIGWALPLMLKNVPDWAPILAFAISVALMCLGLFLAYIDHKQKNATAVSKNQDKASSSFIKVKMGDGNVIGQIGNGSEREKDR